MKELYKKYKYGKAILVQQIERVQSIHILIAKTEELHK